jgi:DNA-binding MarR family transcriptional regulator
MAVFDIGRLDDVIHGRMRLGIMAYLADAEVADFNELKAVLEATQGNLSIHLRKLEDAGYVAIEKSFIGRKPRTRARLTGSGRAAFAEYLDAIARLLGAAAPRDLAAPGDKRGD